MVLSAERPVETTPSPETTPAWPVLRWEWVSYGMIALAAILTRFWDLGARALHHDESLHAVYSWYLYTGRGYQHDPLMHGPFQFHAGALSYFLFGDSDATARFQAAFFGVGVVLLPFLLRPLLGRVGSVLTAGLFLISPVFLYYGRFTREDIYVATFTLAFAICLWRYMASRQTGWLIGSAAALAFAYATKETTFITVAVFGSFFTFRWIGSTLERRKDLPWREAIRGVDFDILIVLGAFTLPQLMPFFTLIFPAVGIQRVEALSLPAPFGVVRQDQLAAVVLVVAALAVSGVIGHLWNRQLFWRIVLVFGLIYGLLYTTFLTNPGGIGTGIWGSLDYWLEQQAVKRGNQPGYYYFILLPIYEFLPLAIAGAGAVIAAFRRSRLWLGISLLPLIPLYLLSLLPQEQETIMKVGGVALLFVTALAVMLFPRIREWNAFLLYWFVGALAAYSIAGEKMPWLSLHMATPALLGAGTALAAACERVNWRRWWHRRGAVAAVAIPVAVFMVLVVLRGSLERTASPLGAVLVAAGAILVLGVAGAWVGSTGGWRQLGVSLVIGLLGLGALFTVRTGLVAAFQNGDVPVEMLVYTQTAPDIPRLAQEIAILERTRPTGQPPRISVDSEEGYTWPWAWYLRDQRATGYPSLRSISAPPAADVVIIHAINDNQMIPFTADYGPGTRFRHRWWFPEDYRDLTLPQFLINLARPESWAIWWDYFFQRRTVSPLGSTDAVIYFPRDFRPAVLP